MKASIPRDARQAADRIAVEASDAEGLDSLDLAWVEGDLNYHTQISGGAINRRFQRTFPLEEVFPGAGERKASMAVIVTVRNTRGATASTTIVVPPLPKKAK